MGLRDRRTISHIASAACLLCGTPVIAQDSGDEIDPALLEGEFVEDGTGGGTDILSADTLTLVADVRIVAADGHRSFADGGFGKTRFSGTGRGDLEIKPVPVEAALIWQPRFTDTFVGNFSAAWQNDQENAVDILEGYLTFIPRSSGSINFALKGGLYWPEISLEHSTGGAWSTVYTITPSAINSWVGEEVKVIGAEATVRVSLGNQDVALTGGAFGFDDTSGTLLSFRGWALHDMKATTFGHFELPPLNTFMSGAQEDVTRSLFEIDDRVGFYGRAEWRPAPPVVLSAFYYDNRGDPEAFSRRLQWGWRTRFWNVGLIADLGPNTRFLAQGMTGTTIMGRRPTGATKRWVHTRYRSVFGLLTQSVGEGAVSGRLEWFDTRERGSRMNAADESEDGWAATAALRWPLGDKFTGFLEALHIESTRGARARSGLPAKEAQTVFQASLRLQW